METQSRHSPTLEDAWFKFGEYDQNASLAQKRFIRRRNLITLLGVVATTLAVIYNSFFIGDHPSILKILGEVLRILIIITPISISILSAIDVKFNLGLSWIVLRSSAEALKKEIYLYRTQVQPYNVVASSTESRDLKLAERLKAIGQRIMETQVNQSGLAIYTGSLPPYAAEGDDGFSDMDWHDYVAWRLEDQFNYYRKKTVKLHKEQTRLQWLITIAGGAGTLLAAINQQIWVAVSSAVSAALISRLEFQQIETTLVGCNQAANDLYSIRAWWRALPLEEQEKFQNLQRLVDLTEQVIQSENAGWVQEMRDALSDVYGETEAESEDKAESDGEEEETVTESEDKAESGGEDKETATESEAETPQASLGSSGSSRSIPTESKEERSETPPPPQHPAIKPTLDPASATSP